MKANHTKLMPKQPCRIWYLCWDEPEYQRKSQQSGEHDKFPITTHKKIGAIRGLPDLR